jgi:hypothetical protein
MYTQGSRIPVSHVGSLVRPPALIEYLQKVEKKEPYDRTAFEACLTESVADAVRRQAECGVDVVSDGEYGKALNWAFYVQMRLTGIERRALTPEEAKDSMNLVLGGRDREAFPEFYAEYDARMIRTGAVRPVVTGPISYSGHAELNRDIANLKAALAKVDVAGGFLPVVAAASALLGPSSRRSPTARSSPPLPSGATGRPLRRQGEKIAVLGRRWLVGSRCSGGSIVASMISVKCPAHGYSSNASFHYQ